MNKEGYIYIYIYIYAHTYTYNYMILYVLFPTRATHDARCFITRYYLKGKVKDKWDSQNVPSFKEWNERHDKVRGDIGSRHTALSMSGPVNVDGLTRAGRHVHANVMSYHTALRHVILCEAP